MNCVKCGAAFSNRQLVNGKIRNLSKRKYCLVCSPFGKHNTRQCHRETQVETGRKICPRCKIEKTTNSFYLRRSGNDFSSYCVDCTLAETRERMVAFKKKALEYKGGKCEQCGYDKCYAAMDFHHIDPTKKDFGIANARMTTFSETVKKELDKCQLLCSNCHRELHAAVAQLD